MQARRAIKLPRRSWVIVGAIVAVLAAALWLARAGDRDPGPPIGLFTTLPILWAEAPDIAAQMNDPAPPHWAQAELTARGRVVPLDVLADPGGQGPLRSVDRLVIAQPRPLSPDENVALDNWVRAGGRLLLLADPALTQHSDFSIGDPRRPQAVALLSPILGRWGLGLQFDEAQPFGERTQAVMDVAVPVNLAGHWQVSGRASEQATCRAWGDGLAVTCAVGRGRVIALADAAVLERDDPGGTRRKALAWLLDAAFIAN